MKYIDENNLTAIQLLNHLEINNFLTADGYLELINNLPNKELFDFEIGNFIAVDQENYLDIIKSIEWKEFLSELSSEVFINFIKNIYKIDNFKLIFQFRYKTSGWKFGPTTSVEINNSDGNNIKIHGMIHFNLNTNWNQENGGSFEFLNQKLDTDDPSTFNNFEVVKSVDLFNKNTALFLKSLKTQWTGIDHIKCDPDSLFKLFTIMIIDA